MEFEPGFGFVCVCGGVGGVCADDGGVDLVLGLWGVYSGFAHIGDTASAWFAVVYFVGSVV
jgi:hypothetical protein